MNRRKAGLTFLFPFPQALISASAGCLIGRRLGGNHARLSGVPRLALREAKQERSRARLGAVLGPGF